MAVIIIKFFVTLFLIGYISCSVLPVEKCNLEDSACMTAAFQKALPTFVGGIPELGVEVADVMEMDDIHIDIAGLIFDLSEGRLKGLKNTIIDNVKWDTKKKSIHVRYHGDCTIKGHYKASGRVLILPISGDGQIKLKLKNLHVSLLINYEIEKGADGKDHVVPKKFKVDYDVKDNAQISLTNLFNGNKQLSDPMMKFLNENWKQISIEFGKPLIDTTTKKIFNNIVAFMEKQALEEIALV